MLAVVSALENNNNMMKSRDEMIEYSEFPDFSDDNLLESIDFDDLFVGMDDDDDVPGLEILSGGEQDSNSCHHHHFNNNNAMAMNNDDIYGGVVDEFISTEKQQPILNKRDESRDDVRGSKSSSKINSSSQGKRKVKVDWTPELHRRFVQAVEQLGVDKAVPSRILEIMGIGCLTRHNIASHLQKYRSHRKHLLAREAEAASWSQRRQMYTPTGTVPTPTATPTPTMGFPHVPNYRPLHVWGHPSMDHRPFMPPIFSKHTTTHVWPPTSWHPFPIPHHQRPPYLPQILPQTRFPTTHVQVPPSKSMYKTDTSIYGVTPSTGQSCPQSVLDLHPSKETIDDAIGEILSKPWQPLPLGLKPPALDSVMVELQRQGIQKVPPPTCF